MFYFSTKSPTLTHKIELTDTTSMLPTEATSVSYSSEYQVKMIESPPSKQNLNLNLKPHDFCVQQAPLTCPAVPSHTYSNSNLR